jgi:hypothetical protein
MIPEKKLKSGAVPSKTQGRRIRGSSSGQGGPNKTFDDSASDSD